MSDKWTTLLKCPQERFSNPVFISADEFVVAPYNYSKQKSDGILKYSTTANKWMTLVKYPKDLQVSNCSLSSCPSGVFILAAKSGKVRWGQPFIFS